MQPQGREPFLPFLVATVEYPTQRALRMRVWLGQFRPCSICGNQLLRSHRVLSIVTQHRSVCTRVDCVVSVNQRSQGRGISVENVVRQGRSVCDGQHPLWFEQLPKSRHDSLACIAICGWHTGRTCFAELDTLPGVCDIHLRDLAFLLALRRDSWQHSAFI